MLKRAEYSWVFQLSESKKKKSKLPWQDKLCFPSSISASLGWMMTATLQEPLTSECWLCLNHRALQQASEVFFCFVPVLVILGSVGIVTVLQNSHFFLLSVAFMGIWLDMLYIFSFPNYVTVCRRAKRLFWISGKLSWQHFLVKFRLSIIRHSLIIQELKMYNFALENRLEKKQFFWLLVNFGGKISFTQLCMEIDHYCHLLASKPPHRNLSPLSHII